MVEGKGENVIPGRGGVRGSGGTVGRDGARSVGIPLEESPVPEKEPSKEVRGSRNLLDRRKRHGPIEVVQEVLDKGYGEGDLLKETVRRRQGGCWGGVVGTTVRRNRGTRLRLLSGEQVFM